MPILATYGTIPARNRHTRFAQGLVLQRDKKDIEVAVDVRGGASFPDNVSIFGLDTQMTWEG